jgi:hypothetical protein
LLQIADSAGISLSPTTTITTWEIAVRPMKCFIDTHDRSNESLPDGLTPAQFEQFYAQYEAACYAE